MADSQWARIKRLFNQVAELPPDSRESHLRASEGDEAIVGAVLDLFADEAVAPDFDGPLARLNRPLAAGARFGAYEVGGLIGRGGMGEVYRAHRCDGQFDQEVAIKLLRRDAIDPELARSETLREQRLLARLSHPNIARIVDAGISDDGQTYFAMEYVDGQTLLDYCQSNELSLADRLSLLVAICEGVHHAHRSLVLHRDLKPENILVGSDGVPKLLDFGIARMIEHGGAALVSTATVRGWSALTPEYASPEQVRGEPLTTGTDVYALGIILFQLLTGERPYTFRNRSPDEIVRAVTEIPVDPPSKRAQQSPSAPFPARKLHGDLDLIVAHAMHRDVSRRYSSAREMAEDIQRHLQGYPITASGDGALYRIGKFVRRHRVAVPLSLLALTLVSGGLAVAWTQNLARLQQASKAEALNRFTQRMFSSVTPSERQGEEFTVSAMLEQGVERARNELLDQPEIFQEVLQKIAETHLAMDQSGPAEEILNLVNQHLDQNTALERWRTEAIWLEASIASNREEWEVAVPLYEQVLGRLEQSRDIERSRMVQARTDLGAGLVELARPQEAEPHLLAAIVLAGQAPMLDARRAKTYLAAVHHLRDELDAALDLIREVHDSAQHWDQGRETARLAHHKGRLARTLYSMGRVEEALELASQAAETAKRLYGPKHRRYGQTLSDLARVLLPLERNEEALAAAREAEEVLSVAQPEGTYYRQALVKICQALAGLDRVGEAVEACRRSLEVHQSQLGVSARETVFSHYMMGSAYFLATEFETALRVFREVIPLIEQSTFADTSYGKNYDSMIRTRIIPTLIALEMWSEVRSEVQAYRRDYPDVNESSAPSVQHHCRVALWNTITLERLGDHEAARAEQAEADRLREILALAACDYRMADRYRASGKMQPLDDPKLTARQGG